MVLEVDEHDELLRVLNEDAPAHREIIVYPRCIMQRRALYIHSNFGEPLLLLLLDSGDLVVLAAQFAQNLHNAPLNLQFGFPGHQGAEGHAPEVPPHANLHVVNTLGDSLNLIQFLREPLQLDLVELVRIPEVKLWVQVLANRPKEI